MALRYPDRLESNNPAAYGIVKAIEIAGHRTVQTLSDLYTIADAILSDSGNNANSDAIGQKWYVVTEQSEYQLIDWNNRKSSSGWKVVGADTQSDISNLRDQLNSHINNKENPHEVTKQQIGLDNVDNTSDLDKPVSTATQQAIDSVKNTIDNYTINGHKINENPTLTKNDVGLGNVTNEAQIPLSQKGAVNGVATLTENGKVPSSQLPAYIDDVLEGTLVSPTEFTLNEGQQGEVKQSGVIYIDTTTNKSYRWSGSQYVTTGSDLALGETSSTAYAGDKGKQVTDRVAEVYGANSVVNGLSDITFDSDDTGAQTLSADNALKTWDGSGTQHDIKIPYATASKAGVMSAVDKQLLDNLSEIKNKWLNVYKYGAARASILFKLTTSATSDNIKAALTDIAGNHPKQAGLDACIQGHLCLSEYIMGGMVMVGWSGSGYVLTYVGQLTPTTKIYACTIVINAVDAGSTTTYSVVRDGVIIEIKNLNNYLPLSGGIMSGNIVFGDNTGYEYVDLGLPSGLLWAKYNVGATNEEEAGLYFQWGDTQGYTAEQVGDGEGLKRFSWADYKLSVDGSSSNFSKYNASDSKTVLDPEDDAAHVNMGGNWRMPTFEEYKELCLNTDIYLVPTEGEEIQGTAQDIGGIIIIQFGSHTEGAFKGVKFYKKGNKQTYMFAPASGGAFNGSLDNVGREVNLYASSLDSSKIGSGDALGLGSGGGVIGNQYRCYGCPVRGVCNSITTGGIIINNKSDKDLLNAAGGTTSISDIISSAEGSLSDLEARVKTNENKLVIVQGEETVDGSIKKALKDSKDYTDSKLTWITLD